MKLLTLILGFTIFFLPGYVLAGLDLENQTQIYIPDLDLDQDGRVMRAELSEYMFFYFDRDGNETLTKGEYHNERAIEVIEYDQSAINFIDLNNDGKNDSGPYTTQSFLETVMVDKDEVAEAVETGQIKALHFMDEWFLNLDINDTGAIEPHEWADEYKMHGVNKPRRRPKSADNNRYN